MHSTTTKEEKEKLNEKKKKDKQCFDNNLSWKSFTLKAKNRRITKNENNCYVSLHCDVIGFDAEQQKQQNKVIFSLGDCILVRERH